MNSILDVIDHLEGSRKEFLESYFKDAPVWIINACKIVEMPEKRVFITEKDKVEYIHILVSGTVKATDYRIFGVAYDFFWFDAVEIFGAMETIIEEENYMTTLITDSPCSFILIRKEEYIRWMKSDGHALYTQARIMTNYLLEQARRERIFLLLQAKDRICVFFSKLYQGKQLKDSCEIHLSREEIANAVGLSVKTVNRNIKVIEKEGLITVRNRKLVISREQFEQIRKQVTWKVDL